MGLDEGGEREPARLAPHNLTIHRRDASGSSAARDWPNPMRLDRLQGAATLPEKAVGRGVMKFGIFYELQLPRPWQDGDELKLYHDALSQLEAADRLGYHYAWVVEHHFLEE